MSKTLRNAVIAALAWIGLVALATAVLWRWALDRTEYTVINDTAKDSEFSYIIDNGKSQGILWQMRDEEVTGFFATEKLAYLEGFTAMQVYVVEKEPYALFQRIRDDEGRIITEYAAVSFNTDMQPYMVTTPFRLDLELVLTGFSATEDTLYVTAVSENRKTVYVYSLPTSSLTEIPSTAISKDDVLAWEGKTTKVKEMLVQGAENQRFYADAEYAAEVLQLRMDNEMPGYFGIDSAVASQFAMKKLSISQSRAIAGISIPVVMLTAIIGAALIILLSLLLQNQKRLVYEITVMEVLLCAVIGVFFFYHVLSNRRAVEQAYAGYGASGLVSVFDGYALIDIESADIYTTNDYITIVNRLRRMAASDTLEVKGPSISDIEIISPEGVVLFSTDGRNFEPVEARYGSDARTLIRNAVANAAPESRTQLYNGDRISLLAVPLAGAGFDGYAGLIIADEDELGEYLVRDYRYVLASLLAFFVIASILWVIIFVIQNRDIAELENTLLAISRGEDEITKPKVIGRDMSTIWNSIFEIQKTIMHTNRIKLLTFEAYYRFAPKSIERILGEDSILEVKNGATVKKNGTVAFLTTSDRLSANPEASFAGASMFDELSEYRQRFDGIFISHNNSLSFGKCLFLEENTHTVEFGIEFLTKLREVGKLSRVSSSIFLHYTPYAYGVRGSEENAIVFMLEPHSEILAEYAEWFRTMRLPLVVTENVISHERTDAALRHIGFILPNPLDDGERLGLYEVLDAEPVAVHRKRLGTKAKFEEALNLFYEQDFYFARNAFSEILKESEDDEITKWYLFECERYLNEAAPENFIGALHKE